MVLKTDQGTFLFEQFISYTWKFTRMKNRAQHDNKILFLFSRKVRGEIAKIEASEIPSEILYGAIELKNNGWSLEISDDRHGGLFGRVNTAIKSYGINLINYTTISRIRANEVVVVKGDFSLMTTLVCRLFGKKIIYKDAMFDVPKRFWKRWSAFINLRLASSVVAYSTHQARIWEKKFKLKGGSIRTMHYCVDAEFYPEIDYEHADDKHLISVGRDPGRDYDCLSLASRLNNFKVKLVTLPYLVSSEVSSNPNIEILQRISYIDLFDLYRNSNFSVIPLREGLNYPTGIRGILESLALGIPTIATRTPVLEEYFTHGDEIFFVDAGDEAALSSAITKLAEDEALANKLAAGGKLKTRSCYNMNVYAKEFEEILVDTINN